MNIINKIKSLFKKDRRIYINLSKDYVMEKVRDLDHLYWCMRVGRFTREQVVYGIPKEEFGTHPNRINQHRFDEKYAKYIIGVYYLNGYVIILCDFK